MRIIIQAILILGAFVVIFMALSNRATHTGRAWKKLGLIFLAILMVMAILFPESTNYIANSLGVGRGADLLLYVLALAFILYVLNSYLQHQSQRDYIHKLARKIAIIEAKEKDKDPHK